MSTRVNSKSRLVDVRVSHDVLTALSEAAEQTGIKPQALLKRYLRNGLIRDGFLDGEVETTLRKATPPPIEPVEAPAASLADDSLDALFRV